MVTSQRWTLILKDHHRRQCKLSNTGTKYTKDFCVLQPKARMLPGQRLGGAGGKAPDAPFTAPLSFLCRRNPFQPLSFICHSQLKLPNHTVSSNSNFQLIRPKKGGCWGPDSKRWKGRSGWGGVEGERVSESGTREGSFQILTRQLKLFYEDGEKEGLGMSFHVGQHNSVA